MPTPAVADHAAAPEAEVPMVDGVDASAPQTSVVVEAPVLQPEPTTVPTVAEAHPASEVEAEAEAAAEDSASAATSEPAVDEPPTPEPRQERLI